MTERNEINGTILAGYPRMSAKEQRIADYFLNTEIVSLRSAQELAEKTGTSSATVVRFCRRLGFDGFSEFKYSYQHPFTASLRGNVPINDSDSTKTILKKFGAFSKNAIDDVVSVMSENVELERAIEAIEQADKTVFFAEGGSGGIAISAANGLCNVGLHCEAVTDGYTQIVTASFLGKNDVAIGICHRGDIIDIIQALDVANRRGATTISIVGQLSSPIMKYTDIALFAGTKSISPNDVSAQRICELFIISALQCALFNKNFERLSQQAKVVKKFTKVKRMPIASPTDKDIKSETESSIG